MTAKNLIQLASEKGYGISRYKSGIYEYGYSDGQKWIANRFFGTWSEFVKFIKQIDPVK